MGRKKAAPSLTKLAPEGEKNLQDLQDKVVDLLSVENPDVMSCLVETVRSPLSSRLGSSSPIGCCPVTGHFSIKDMSSQIFSKEQLALTPIFEKARAREAEILQTLRDSSPKSSKGFDSAFSKILSASESIQRLPCNSVLCLISDLMEKRANFFPRETIKTLLGHQAVSDYAHLSLVEQLLGTGEAEWVHLVLEHVADLKESSVAKCIVRILDSQETSCSSPDFTETSAPDSLLLALLSWDFNASAMKLTKNGWNSSALKIMLRFLIRILKLYRDVSSEHLVTGDQDSAIKLPSRPNTLKWIETILDISQLGQSELHRDLVELKTFIKEETLTSKYLLLIKAQISTLSYLTSKRAFAAISKDKDTINSDSYSLHMVTL